MPETLDAPAARPMALVVEDELPLRELVKRILEGAGYRVSLAADGRAGIEAVGSDRPDVVLLDYRMPVLDGPGFLAEYERIGVTSPVILVTASPEATALSERFGCEGIVAKPFGAQELISAVARALERPDEAEAVPAPGAIETGLWLNRSDAQRNTTPDP